MRRQRRGPAAMKFGDYIREIREKNGWTQPEAAIKAGIEQSYLSKLETGKSWPSEEVFARLGDAYGFAGVDVVARVEAGELTRLKEIGDVRAAVLDRQRRERRFARGWLVAMLALLMAGGSCLGLSFLSDDTNRWEFDYTSMGVLEAGEPLQLFDIIDLDVRSVELEKSPNDPRLIALKQEQAAVMQRVDVETRTTDIFRGDDFIEEVDGGRRLFRFAQNRAIAEDSPLRWFLVPALAFLIGSVGCAFISWRWR